MLLHVGFSKCTKLAFDALAQTAQIRGLNVHTLMPCLPARLGGPYWHLQYGTHSPVKTKKYVRQVETELHLSATFVKKKIFFKVQD